MGEEKRFFWIKLKTDFFHEDSPIDFLLSQPNGSEYVVLYIKLCLMTANGGGKLQKQIGEMIIPYDVDKITRDMKYFSRDTVIVALEMYKKLGLIYQDTDGILTIANHDKLVGSETAAAERMRKSREKAKECNNVTPELQERSQQCYLEYREQSTEYRDKTEGTISDEIVCQTQSVSLDVKEVAEAWNDLQGLGIKPVSKMSASSTRYKALSARIREHGKDKVLEAIENIKASNFLQGMNDKGWVITFDWFVKPNNFVKVLDGNYNNRVTREQEKKGDDRYDGIKSWAIKNGLNAGEGSVVDDSNDSENSVSDKGFFGF